MGTLDTPARTHTHTPYSVIHKCLNAAYDGEVKLTSSHVNVHGLQETQHVLQSMLLYETQHKAAVEPHGKVTKAGRRQMYTMFSSDAAYCTERGRGSFTVGLFIL